MMSSCMVNGFFPSKTAFLFSLLLCCVSVLLLICMLFVSFCCCYCLSLFFVVVFVAEHLPLVVGVGVCPSLFIM